MEMGGSRSLLGAYNLVRAQDGKEAVSSAPGSWRRWSERWRWDDAARGYDARVAEIALAGIATGVLDARLAVAGTSKAVLDLLRKRVEQLAPEDIPSGSIAGLMREAVSGLFRATGYDPRQLLQVQVVDPGASGNLVLPGEWTMEEIEEQSRSWHESQAAAQIEASSTDAEGE